MDGMSIEACDFFREGDCCRQQLPSKRQQCASKWQHAS